MDHNTIPAEPGWTAVLTGDIFSSYTFSRTDDTSDNWRVELGHLELYTFPVIAWDLATRTAIIINNGNGTFAPIIGSLNEMTIGDDAMMLVGVYHPEHQPAPKDLEHYATKMAERTVLAHERRELHALEAEEAA